MWRKVNLTENPKALREILALRASGWPISTLAIRYEKDRTSIRHHLNKYAIVPLNPIIKTNFKPQVLEKKLVIFQEERINQGKTYKEYVAEAKRRHPKEFWHVIPKGTKKMSDILVETMI